MASSEPILCPSVSTTSWPRQSRMFSASNMPIHLLNSATPPLSRFYPDGSRRPLPATVADPGRPGCLSRGLIGPRWRYRSPAAPVFTTGPGQQFLVDEIPPQRRVVVVDGPQEPADAV